jgi:hypothetical protein
VFEIGWVARKQRKVVGERHGSDHCVVGPGAGLAPCTVDRRGDATERSGRCGIEGKGVEVGFRLLEAQLARRSLGWLCRHKGTDGELGERHSRDERFRWEGLGISDPLEQNHGTGVEDASV